MDAARKWTDKQLEDLEKRISREYRKAINEMRSRQKSYLARFADELEMREKALDNTPEALAAHKRWLENQATKGAWINGMVAELAERATKANEKAAEIMNGAIPTIYAENANMAAFAIDKAIMYDTAFTLLDEKAVTALIEAGAKNMPILREVNHNKDIRWNRQKFTSAITQGILQGESVPNIVKRTNSIYDLNKTAAVRAVRTATTNAENMGRMSSFERAESMGIDIEVEWQATLDERTRESHAAIDGERIKPGEKFSNGLRYPGDPAGEPEEVWNCRCRADGVVTGFDGVKGDWLDDSERWARLPQNMTYEKWKTSKAKPRDALRENGRWINEARRVKW